ncbi:hypothetical protein NFI96_031467 [Prochilodus magdalenae]|nr:hypothetical protein NFI96_031467 [Prochilodus magdalenae]
MRMTFRLLLLLLALWIEDAHGERSFPEKNMTKEHERVLIRTKRRWVLSTIELEEEDPGPYPKEATQLFNDKVNDHQLLFSINGQGVNTEPTGVLTINDLTGVVYVHKPIDREMYPFFQLLVFNLRSCISPFDDQVEFDVLDRQTKQVLDRTLSFNVAIKDKNDNAPQFLPEVLNLTIPENTKEGTLPVSLQAKDKDEKGNDNSRITMRVVSQQPASPPIALKSLSSSPLDDNVISQLTFTGCFDYDKARTYKLLVEAQDHGLPKLSSTATVNINITDSNTHLPVFTASRFDAQVMEMETNKVILRLSVEDKDTPNTPASKAVYKILKGNEEGNYKIETDPKTNEGVLTVIKGKDYERTTLTELEISVENEEPLFICVDGKPESPTRLAAAKPNTTKVAVKVIDVNDPPVFTDRIKTVYRKEEGQPGDNLYEPVVKDVDSDVNKTRYELAEDPGKWVKVDPKTGKVTTVVKMDRESPYVVNNTYTVLIRAIDDGEPPATGTGTLIIHLGDMNDNLPYLTTNSSILCANKTDRVTVKASDDDASPFAGPFSFSVGGEDKELAKAWKFEPGTGFETSLISLKSLPYGNFTIPLRIEDQQGQAGEDVLHLEVCDCGDHDVCRRLFPRSTHLHGAALGILLGSLLLLALLLCFIFICNNGKEFKLNLQDEGNQTLINYNEEGGGSLAKVCISSGGFQQMAENNGTWRSQSGASRFSRSYSVMSEWNIEDHLHRKLYELPEEQLEFPQYHPREYIYEGSGSRCLSLDELSFSAHGDDLEFLDNLGPKFQTLEGVCQKALKEKSVKV